MMDSQHQNQDHPHTHNYAFNPTQNDAFNSFLHTDSEQPFNSSWDTDGFADPQDSINGFNPGNSTWGQTTIQPSQLLPVANYGVQPRSLDQAFSGNPPYNFSGPSFNSTLAYGPPLTDDPNFDFTRNQNFQRTPKQSETISPQALQHFPANFTNVQIPEARPSQQFSQPIPTVRRGMTGGSSAQASVTRQDWRSMVSSIPKGIPNGIFTSRSPADLTSATNSTPFKGFTFVGNSTLELNTNKAIVPRYNPRRSKNEIWHLLLQEKGNNSTWSSARAPVIKKLRRSLGPRSLPRSVPSSATSQGLSTLDLTSSPESLSDSDPEGSEYSSGSDEENEPDEPSPLPQNRPIDPSNATEYDALKAVWAPRNRILSVAAIRTALGDFWVVVKGIRDKWKSENLDLQQAEQKKNQPKIAQLTRSISEQRRLLESCIRLALTHGHQDITEKFGENPQLFLVFYQFTADRFKEGEYAGSLIRSILELMTRCTTLDQVVLEKTKLDKVLPRIVRKGDEEGKELAQKVLQNAVVNSKQKNIDGKPSQVQEPKEKDSKNVASNKPPTDNSRISNGLPGIKKPRTVDASAEQPVRKATDAGFLTKSNGQVGKRPQTAKLDPKVVAKSAPVTTPLNPKFKTNHISVKPSGFFSSLQSASKKPGTSNAALLSAKSKEGKDGPSVESRSTPVASATPAAAPAAKPTFSFAETMANLNKQKEVQPSKLEESGPPETPEEKRKRERKLERRKLRVSFKPDDSLVEIRTFMHDPEEELGHEDSLVRDVGDSRGEGQMLKMHKDLDLMDEDEDAIATEESFAPWKTPSLVDFSVIEPEEIERNSVTKGGKAEVKSRERGVQEQREQTTLMVIYTTPLDIPSTPREPSDPFSGEMMIEQSFGDPTEETRARAAQYYATQGHPYRAAGNPLMTTQPPTPDISALLQIINNQQQPQPQPPKQLPVTQAPVSGLEAIFAQFSANNQQPSPMQVPQPSQPATSFDFQTTLAAFSAASQARPTYGQNPPTQPNLQSLLSQLGQQPSAQLPNYAYGNNYQADNDRKRQLDYDDQGSGEYGYAKGKRQKADGAKRKYYGVPTLPCKFWQEGKCRRGEECTFLHEQHE